MTSPDRKAAEPMRPGHHGAEDPHANEMTHPDLFTKQLADCGVRIKMVATRNNLTTKSSGEIRG